KQREFSARSVSTWLEQIVDDAVSVSLYPVDCSRQEQASGSRLPLAAGVVRAGGVSVAWGEVPPPPAGAVDDEPALVPGLDTDSGSASDSLVNVASDAGEESDEFASLWIDDEDDGGSEPASFEDHDGMTVMNSEVVALRQQLPAWEGDAVPGPMVDTAARRTVPKIVLSTGTAVALDRPVLLGRAPQVSRVRNDEMPRLVTVESPNHDISRTHAEVRMNDDDIMVTDLNSTNGVLLTRPGAVAQRLTSGEPTVVEAGAIVDLGEGVTFVVGRQT
ncbi:MAG TPA: FHA domain-containing protein, partial [Beutenbergiaceae bacterium]|nr:FHA domain-containing protein [Beutenbergiaceae bacterium]